jgi:hypothetical protein
MEGLGIAGMASHRTGRTIKPESPAANGTDLTIKRNPEPPYPAAPLN